MSRRAAGAPKGGRHLSVSDARAMAALAITAAGLAVMGATILLRLKQLQSD